MTASDFTRHLSRLGIPVVRLDAAEAESDMDTLEKWLTSCKPNGSAGQEVGSANAKTT
jgi:hypothetical protein